MASPQLRGRWLRRRERACIGVLFKRRRSTTSEATICLLAGAVTSGSGPSLSYGPAHVTSVTRSNDFDPSLLLLLAAFCLLSFFFFLIYLSSVLVYMQMQVQRPMCIVQQCIGAFLPVKAYRVCRYSFLLLPSSNVWGLPSDNSAVK